MGFKLWDALVLRAGLGHLAPQPVAAWDPEEQHLPILASTSGQFAVARHCLPLPVAAPTCALLSLHH